MEDEAPKICCRNPCKVLDQTSLPSDWLSVCSGKDPSSTNVARHAGSARGFFMTPVQGQKWETLGALVLTLDITRKCHCNIIQSP